MVVECLNKASVQLKLAFQSPGLGEKGDIIDKSLRRVPSERNLRRER